MHHRGNGPHPSIVNRPERLPPQLRVYGRDFGADRLNSCRPFCKTCMPIGEKHGKSVIERVRRDDPSTYLRVMASIVRAASEPELEDPLAQMTVEELKAELLAGLVSLFPELRVVAAQGQALIAGTRGR